MYQNKLYPEVYKKISCVGSSKTKRGVQKISYKAVKCTRKNTF